MPEQKTKRRILVAEDVPVIAHVSQLALEDAGYLVAVVKNGQECLDQLEIFEPDLIVLDLVLPKVHGIEILKKVKGDPKFQKIGVVVCTAKSFKTELDQIRELGADDIIVKPFQKEELINAVNGFFAENAEMFAAIEFNPADLNVQPGTEPIAGVEDYNPRLNTSDISFRLWGTRGSTPISGAKYLRHGGNTTCMEIDYGDEKIIFDAGSGIRDAGLAMMAEGRPRHVHLFITHTHWDHIQGFPFFIPAFVPGYEISLYGAEGFGKSLKEIFQGQHDRDYFPVQMEDMQAKLNFHHLKEEHVQIGDINVSWEFTNHPGACLGYKIEADGRSIAFMPDNEFLKAYIGSPHELSRDSEIMTLYLKLIDFLTGVDVLIGESQYMVDEYPQKIGWGHSSISNGALLAKLADVRKWIVTHHDPMHDDDFLQDKLNLTRQIVHSLDHPIDVVHGFDGMREFLE